ncbi:MAG: FAD-binding protein, partial [Thermoplasmata archaeon]|nr:FAD-binding protein [Thermoplasmata archaeon]
MNANVLVVIERREATPVRAALEATGVARRISGPPGAGQVTALVLGTGLETSAGTIATLGVDRVLTVTDPRFDSFQTALWAAAIAAIARELSPSVILLGGTCTGRQLVGRIAARWGAAAATGVTDVTIGPGGELSVVRPVFSGRALQEVRLEAPRAVLGLRPNAFPIPAVSAPPAPISEHAPLELGPLPPGAVVTGLESAQSTSGPDLSEATVIVAGGRGVKSPENFRLLDELA